MNRVDMEAVHPNSVRVGSTGIGFIGEPRRKKEYSPTPSLHPSVVDAWVFSGYSNDNPPAGIRGVKGNEFTLNNFAYTEESGFNNATHKGSLVLDGVKDYLLLNKLNYKIATVLIGTSFLEAKAIGVSFLFDADEVRTYLAYENGAMIASANSIAKSSVNGNIEATYNVSDITQPLYIGHSGVGDNYLKFGLRYIAPYGAILTAEEKIEERIKLEEMWRKRNV